MKNRNICHVKYDLAIQTAKNVFEVEIEGLVGISKRIDSTFVSALELILCSKGRVVVLGMGKSGIIGKKIAATLASTGTASFFVHPAEAFHGDLGMILPNDVALMISNSGETEELLKLLPFLNEQLNQTISLIGNINSTLARNSNVALEVSVHREACTNNLAPTSSTTAALVMGDALAVALSKINNFKPEDFARFHPGGNLGKRLLTRVSDVMCSKNIPICALRDDFRTIIHCINRGRLGLAVVIENEVICGIITDGDIRRAFDQHSNPLELISENIMSRNPKTIHEKERLIQAEKIMIGYKINSLIVINSSNHLAGILQIYDIAY